MRSLESAEIKYFWLLTPAEIPLPDLAGLRGQLLASQLSSAPVGEGDSPGEERKILSSGAERGCAQGPAALLPHRCQGGLRNCNNHSRGMNVVQLSKVQTRETPDCCQHGI